MKTNLLLFLLISPILCLAQENSWGIGILRVHPDCTTEINVYNAPHGKVTGTLTRESGDQYPRRIEWLDEMGPRMYIPDNALLEVEYEINAIIVFEAKDGFLRIMFSEGEFTSWVSEEDLKGPEFSYWPWMKFMLDSGNSFFTSGYGMNVREAPTVKASRILTVKGDQFDISPTGKHEGLWAEVIIKEYDSVYCEEPHNLVKTYKGWMKILDDKGFPNVWFYTRGC
ncbi:MAG: hypothetical protein AB8F74_04005 [Saprospiraceae bacterium]